MNWEYISLSVQGKGVFADVKTINDKKSVEQLNVLGDEGWELVAVTQTQWHFVFILKRPKG